MKLNLKQLTDMISSFHSALKEARKYKELGIDIRGTELWYNLEHCFDIALTLYFGETVSEIIWNFILEDSSNQFETIEELYEFLSDKYSEIVSKDSALTLDQLKILFPTEVMFKYFDQTIKEYNKK